MMISGLSKTGFLLFLLAGLQMPAGPGAAQELGPAIEAGLPNRFAMERATQDQVTNDEPVWGNEPYSLLTLEDLQAKAIQRNPSLQRAAAAISAARGRQVQVGLGLNPEVGIDFQQLGSAGQAEQYGAILRQEFIRGEKLQLNRAVVGHQIQQLEQQFRAQRQRVLTDVRIAYLRALRAQRQIDVARELLLINERAVEAANQLLMAREVSRTDVLQAQIEVQNARLALRQAENSHAAVWRELAALTADPQMVVQSLAGELFEERTPIQFEQALSILQQFSPELAAAAERIEEAKCQLAREQVEPLPNVSVEGLFNWRDNGINGNSDGGLAVSLPLPLRNRNQGAIQSARFNLVAAQREFDHLSFSFQQRLAPVYRRYANARQAAETFRLEIIPRAEETLELTRNAYEVGEVNFISLLTIQRTYAENRLQYIDSLEALRVAEAEIEGLLLLGSFGE